MKKVAKPNDKTIQFIALLVGPEGGWSNQERETLRNNKCMSLKLGGRVLRAETAVYAGLTIIQHLFGDM